MKLWMKKICFALPLSFGGAIIGASLCGVTGAAVGFVASIWWLTHVFEETDEIKEDREP